MVSKAALSQLGPQIEQMVRAMVQNLGSQLASHQASTLENLFSRTVVLERILMEKYGLTSDDLSAKVADIEDEKEKLTAADAVETGDVVRLSIRTKTKDQTEYQGESRLKVYDTGSGNTLGVELEQGLLGAKVGEVRTTMFGKDKELQAEMTISRVARPPKVAKEETNDQNAGK